MKTLTRITLLFLFVSQLSCDDILEEDITSDTIQISYPQNIEIFSNVVNFQWTALGGADKYRIQVYSSQQIVLDSLVSSTTATFPMNPGEYQWRVRGENFAYVSTYSVTANFTVTETSDLTNQQVLLNYPPNNLATNNPSIAFSWQSITFADSYSFELINESSGGTLVYQQTISPPTTLTLNDDTITQDGEYVWRVKAINATSETTYTSRAFYLDRINPNQPALNFPINNSTHNSTETIVFEWSTPNDSGIVTTPISYVIEFSTFLNFSSIFQSSTATGNTFEQIMTTSGDYFWRVKARDSAGNESVASDIFKFTVN